IGPAGRLGPGAHVGEWLGLRPVDHRLQGYERGAAMAAASGREGGPGGAGVAGVQAAGPGAAAPDPASAQQTLGVLGHWHSAYSQRGLGSGARPTLNLYRATEWKGQVPLATIPSRGRLVGVSASRRGSRVRTRRAGAREAALRGGARRLPPRCRLPLW